MALSDDLRKRVVGAVARDGMSRNAEDKRSGSASPAPCAGCSGSERRARFPRAGTAAPAASRRMAIICWGSFVASRI